jgi:hypothetical protein
MSKYKITAPVARFRGEVVGVVFHDGTAILSVPDGPPSADDPATRGPRAALTYFQRKGYRVEPLEPQPAEPQAAPQVTPEGDQAAAAAGSKRTTKKEAPAS